MIGPRLVVLFTLLLSVPAAFGQSRAGNQTLALTFAYEPVESMEAVANGYREHLKWHVENEDPILWYAWFVIQGERIGHFVDGAYDVTGAEFDARPDPAGDGRDAAQTFAPHVKFSYRRVFRLRDDLSTSRFLEERSPSPLMQVVYYRVPIGKQRAFEAAARSVAFGARGRGGEPYTIYEMLSGAEGALYAMYIPLQGMASFDSRGTSLATIAARVQEDPSNVNERLAESVASATFEVWQYRPDLSLLPE